LLQLMTAHSQGNANMRRLEGDRRTEPGTLWPMLHAIQDEIGYFFHRCVAPFSLDAALDAQE
jgi:hypothetical protein